MRVALELQPLCAARSGVGHYAYELIRRLRDTDEIEFRGNLFNFLNRNDNSAALSGIGMPIKTCALFPYGVYRRVWSWLPLRYERLFPEADLSVFFNYIVPPHVSGRIITTCYDMTYLRYPETMNARNRSRLEKGMARSVRRSEHILTISEFSKREIVELLEVPEERVSVVPCAPSLPERAADFGGCAKKWGIRGPYLLYMGTIEPRKNLARLIRAFAQLKRESGVAHQLVLAGGSGWANEEIYRAAEGARDVLFTGYVTQEEKRALYEHAAAFVFPSLYEGFGMPPVEAMALGCPVVCADAASLPEVTGDAAELVNPLDEADIARGIYRVISDSEYARELVRRGRERVKRYTWDASAERLVQVCKAVLEA